LCLIRNHNGGLGLFQVGVFSMIYLILYHERNKGGRSAIRSANRKSATLRT